MTMTPRSRLLPVVSQVSVGLVLGSCLGLSSAHAQPACIASAIATKAKPLSSSSRLMEGDRCHQKGDEASAKQWYEIAKKPFESIEEKGKLLEKNEDPTQLSTKGKVFWRNYQQANAPTLGTGTFVPLFLLTENDPNFVPGHMALVQAFEKEPEWCEKKGNAPVCEGHATNKAEALSHVSAIFPKDAALAEAKIAAFVENKDYLDASIAARQFSLQQNDSLVTNQYSELADKYMGKYRSALKRDLIAKTVLGCGISTLVGGNLSGCGVASMLLEGESSFGARMSAATKQQTQIVADPEVQKYVTEIGQHLVPYTGREDFQYEFIVIQDKSINAFALPGGKVFVNSGAILASNSSAELAGLLSHEIAHAALSHGYQKVTQSNFMGNLTSMVPFGQVVHVLTDKAHSRSKEREADDLGAKILTNAGYAADGLRNFMIVMEKEEKASGHSGLPAWLSTHPTTPKRIAYLEALIVRNGYNRYGYEGIERHQQIQKLLQP